MSSTRAVSIAAITLIAAFVALRSAGGAGTADHDRLPAGVRKEIESLAKARSAPLDRFQQITLLGNVIFFRRDTFGRAERVLQFLPHAGEGVRRFSSLNQTTASYPGSIRARFSARRAQSHTYASYSPVLHYNQEQGDFVGGQFWDMRATGLRLDSSLAEQAQGPPLNPLPGRRRNRIHCLFI